MKRALVLGTRKRLTPAAIVALVFIGAWLSGAPFLLRAAYVLVIVTLTSYVLVTLNVRRLEARIDPGVERCQVGQTYVERVSLSNTDLFPKVFLEVMGSGNLPGHGQGKVVSMLPGHGASWETRTRCQIRGLYQVGTASVVSGDPWGLFRRELTLGTPRDLMVFPATVDLPNFALPTLDPRGDGLNPRFTIHAPPTFSAVRDYVPGDSFSRIHWPSTARTGQLMVKDFKVHPTGEVWVIPDLYHKVQAGAGSESTEEYAIIIAASVIRQFLDINYSVGLLTQGNSRVSISPQRGPHSLWRMLEALTLVKAQGSLPLTHLLAQEAERFGYWTTLVVITPAGSDLDVPTFRRVQPAGARTAVIVLDAASFGGKDGSLALAQKLTSIRMETYLVPRGADIAWSLDSRIEATARLKLAEAPVKV